MLNAEVRTDYGSVHFFGEVNGYNLQTLGVYATQSARFGDCDVRLSIQIEPGDEGTFAQFWQPWLRRLLAVGARVAIQVGPASAERRARAAA